LERSKTEPKPESGDQSRDENDTSRPRQPPYGFSENYGSPGGDEPPASTDPGQGTGTEARDRE
jgi:hypothetical protein